MNDRSVATGERVVRIVGGVLTAAFGVPFLLFGWIALNSRFGSGGADLHGYAVIFGTVLALGAGLITAAVLPLAVRADGRSAAYRWCMGGYLLVAAVLVAALLTA